MANYNAKVTLEISASKLPQLYPNVQAVTCVKVLIRQVSLHPSIADIDG